MNTNLRTPWLVGANGVYSGSPMGEWRRVGSFDFYTNAIAPRQTTILAGVNCGLWQIDRETERWSQLHDETVTEVLTVADGPDGADILVGCPYGIATPTSIEYGARRWTFYSNDLRVNERFTNVLLRMSDTQTYLVGTEAGILIFDYSAKRFTRTSLMGLPVRGLLYVDGIYFAGSDGKGVWKSTDGEAWYPAGRGTDGRDILCLAFDGKSVVAGTERGFLVGSESGPWADVGPSILVASLAVDPEGDGRWLAGGVPSGLWWTEDSGGTFRRTGSFNSVRSVSAPFSQAKGSVKVGAEGNSKGGVS